MSLSNVSNHALLYDRFSQLTPIQIEGLIKNQTKKIKPGENLISFHSIGMSDLAIKIDYSVNKKEIIRTEMNPTKTKDKHKMILTDANLKIEQEWIDIKLPTVKISTEIENSNKGIEILKGMGSTKKSAFQRLLKNIKNIKSNIPYVQIAQLNNEQIAKLVRNHKKDIESRTTPIHLNLKKVINTDATGADEIKIDIEYFTEKIPSCLCFSKTEYTVWIQYLDARKKFGMSGIGNTIEEAFLEALIEAHGLAKNKLQIIDDESINSRNSYLESLNPRRDSTAQEINEIITRGLKRDSIAQEINEIITRELINLTNFPSNSKSGKS